MKNKQINIQLRADVEKERKAIEFLEDKATKFIILEALELYRMKYEAMFTGEGGGNSTAATSEEEVVPVKKKANAAAISAIVNANN